VLPSITMAAVVDDTVELPQLIAANPEPALTILMAEPEPMLAIEVETAVVTVTASVTVPAGENGKKLLI